MEYKSPKARKKPFSPFVVRLLREKLMAFSLRHLTSPPDAKSRRIATAALPQKRGLPGCLSLAPTRAPHTTRPSPSASPGRPVPLQPNAGHRPGLPPPWGHPSPSATACPGFPPSGRHPPPSPAPSETGGETRGGSGSGGTIPSSLPPPAAEWGRGRRERSGGEG